jgi:hypothetical protein
MNYGFTLQYQKVRGNHLHELTTFSWYADFPAGHCRFSGFDAGLRKNGKDTSILILTEILQNLTSKYLRLLSNLGECRNTICALALILFIGNNTITIINASIK